MEDGKVRYDGPLDNNSLLEITTIGDMRFYIERRSVAFPIRASFHRPYNVVVDSLMPDRISLWYVREMLRLSTALKISLITTPWVMYCNEINLRWQSVDLSVLDPSFGPLRFESISVRAMEPVTRQEAYRRHAETS